MTIDERWGKYKWFETAQGLATYPINLHGTAPSILFLISLLHFVQILCVCASECVNERERERQEERKGAEITHNREYKAIYTSHN